ncbi:MAG: hypothetical protein WBV61_05115 [Rhodanobacteraceae bacterium]
MADWRDDYARGLEAVHDGKWSEAKRYMQSAISGNATPASRVRLYGQRYETYVPQLYAGLAAYKLGDCGAALRYWNAPAAKSFSGGGDLVAAENRGRNDCASRSIASTQPAAPPPAEVPSTESESSTPSQAHTPTARTVVASVTPRKRPAKPIPKPPAEEPRPPNPADTLRPLLDAYLAGKYSEVIRLSSHIKADGKVRWHVQVLRAAAAYREASLGDNDALSIARTAVAEAHQSDPNQRPDPAFFSPHFLAFFQKK